MREDLHEIEFTTNPSLEVLAALTKGINDDSNESGIHSDVEPFGLVLRDKNEKIIAGASGFVLYGGIYTAQLWVDKLLRGKGFGKMLMDKIHDYARSKGCLISTLRTMSFQKALKFYEKLGYYVEYKQEGYENGHSCLYLVKSLKK